MENSTNRTFYNMEETDELVKEYKEDRKKKGDKFVAFRTRFPDELVGAIKSIGLDWEKDIGMCKKANHDGARDRVEEYDFTRCGIEFDNSKAKDVIANHSVLVARTEDKDDLMNDLINRFGSQCSFRTANTKSITCQLGTYVAPRGVWRNPCEVVPGCTQPIANIKYPICIVSYKRANEYGRTHLLLSKMKIPHYIFVEPQEADEYRKWLIQGGTDEYGRIVVAPDDFSKFNMGSTPMRNLILEWAWKRDLDRVWILDDNIKEYLRYYQGTKNPIRANEIFASVERYIDCFDNVGLVSHNFNPFINEGDYRSCIVKNGKCYSSMLVPVKLKVRRGYNQGLMIRFRYKHQEDNLISMEYISNGYCNLCFNHILYDKNTSGVDKGGNAVSIYKTNQKTKDGEGYKERYEYFECVLKMLAMEGKLRFKDGKGVNDLIKRSTTMKSKEYHASLDYTCLLEHDRNDIKIKKDRAKYKPLEFVELYFVKK